MFEWLWTLLYSLSQILFEVIDGILAVCNKVIGVEPINVGGKDVNFITVLFGSNGVRIGFIAAGLIGIFLLMIFSTIAICRAMKNSKKSIGEIMTQVFKTIGIFLIIPALMIGFTSLLNVLVQIMFNATRGGSESIGKFLFDSFRPVGMNNVDAYVDWRDVNSVRAMLSIYGYSLSDYRFFFSWLVCIPLLFFIAKSMFLFVDRTLSIMILFIFSPISMSTSVLDDGARFKIWRDKVFAKFISGYGMIIAINIYILVLSFITRRDVVLFPGDDPIPFLCNFLIKCAFAIGGAFFLPKVFGLVGDLFVSGGGTGEFREYDSAVGEIKAFVRDRQNARDRAERQKLQKQQAGGGGGGFRGVPAGKDGGGKGGPSGNQFNKKVGNNSNVGSKVANAIKGQPKQQPPKKEPEQKSDNSSNFAKVFGISKEEYGNRNAKNGVAGENTVKNTVSSIVSSGGGNQDDKKEKK